MYYVSFYMNSGQLNKITPQSYTIGRGKYAKKYLDLCIGFDIETTNVINEDGKSAYMWVWQMSINDDIIYGRTWAELESFIEYIKDTFTLRPELNVIVWVANLGFEFQFIRKRFEISSLFAKEERQPLKFMLNGCFEFRDALAVTGGSLAYLANTYTSTQKLVGDLDYSIPRNRKTPIYSSELKYIENDVRILAEFARYIFDTYVSNGFLPITKTNILKHKVKESAKIFCKNYGKNGMELLYNSVSSLYPQTSKLYLFEMEYLFRGGFVHANAEYSDLIIEDDDMAGIDFTSSYPAVMHHCYVPVTPFKELKVDNIDIDKLCDEYCVIMMVDFTKIKAKTSHTIESKSKIINVDNGFFDNGRLFEATKIRVMLTELDYQNYKDAYTWKSKKVVYCKVAKRGKLPAYLLDCLDEDYAGKCKLKKDGLSGTTEYAIKKSNVNTYYGLTVSRLIFNDIIYDSKTDSWGHTPTSKSYTQMIEKQVLSPYWGIYITAHARRREIKTLFMMQDDVMYSDTDSHKIRNYTKNKKLIDNFNQSIIALNDKYAEAHNFSEEKAALFEDLGTFDYEGKITKFKTLGAKRYIYTDEKGFHSTVSGLPKGIIEKYANACNSTPFEIFENKMIIPSTFASRLTTSYSDEYKTTDITDIFGNTVRMCEESSVALYEVPFTLNLDRDYIELLLKVYERSIKTYEN